MTIYKVTNLVNGKIYIGQTITTPARRWQFHLVAARSNSPSALHCAIRRYGEHSFSLCQLDSAESIEELNRKEIFYIAQLRSMAPNGYNLTIGGDSRGGFKHSEETRKKISDAGLGRIFSEERNFNISQSRLGKSPSKETRKKISATLTGRVFSEEARKRSSEFNKLRPQRQFCRRGHFYSDENVYVDSAGGRHCMTCSRMNRANCIVIAS